MSDDEDGLELDEEAERSWRRYLADFRSDVWPLLQEYGFTSFEVAFQCWLLNRVSNDLKALIDQLKPEL